LGHLQVDVITAGGTASHCYGWAAGAWRTLLVEDATDFNLRVKLYDGANGVDAHLLSASSLDPAGLYGLNTLSHCYLWRTATSTMAWYTASALGDGNNAWHLGPVGLYGYNGADWDRLRVDAAYNLQVDVNEVRKTNTSTIAQVAVGVASTAVLAANANRIFAEFVNDSANVIYLALGAAAVMNRGIRLNANGGSFEIGLTNLYTGAVKAISGVAAQNLTVSEG
ncbi:unnamed protein product, partial [marine sediment metagenome]